MSILTHIMDCLQGKTTFDIKRSGSWPAVRASHLRKYPTCAVCGGTKFLTVHHIVEFHKHPEMELESDNLITLCEHPYFNDHLRYGHLGNYKSINPNVKRDARTWLIKIGNRN